MESGNESQDDTFTDADRLERGLALVDECYDHLFEQAPVMLHSIDDNWNLVGVNSKWLTTLGYEACDVLGRRSIEFLSEQSRSAAQSETLPLFWRIGKARSIGYEMVTKNGRTLEVLLDADLDTDSAGNRHTLAAIRERRDQTAWQDSVAVLQALTALARVRRAIEAVLVGDTPAAAGVSPELSDILPNRRPMSSHLTCRKPLRRSQGVFGPWDPSWPAQLYRWPVERTT